VGRGELPPESRFEVLGVIYGDGREDGEAARLDTMKSAWKARVMELQGLQSVMDLLVRNQMDELEAGVHLNNRMVQLRREKETPGITRRELRERNGALIEVEFFKTMLDNLLQSVRTAKIPRATAREYVRTALLGRLKANRDLVSGLKED
jgi:hypothetical protein